MGRAPTATRRLQFCAGHRVHLHESKCANMHGHNYVLFFTARRRAEAVDSLGRVLDFGVMKEKLGDWIDKNWDHGFIYYCEDRALHGMFETATYFKSFSLPLNPTAENMATYLLETVCPSLFKDTAVEIIRVRLWETENCYAEVNL